MTFLLASVEYLAVWNEELDTKFMLLVEKGFDKSRGFFCLLQLENKFKKQYKADDLYDISKHGLNITFKPVLKEFYVKSPFSIF